LDRRTTIVLLTLLAVGCGARDEGSAVPVATPAATPAPVAQAPPPPPPPAPSGPISVRVEFPDGRVVETVVTDADCPTTNTCDYYDVGPYIQAGLRKSGLSMHESCTGPASNRACTIDAIDGLADSAQGRWVMFRNGHRNPYPYNQVLHENQPQAIVFRFLSPSDRTP
jgi:hypothetical protein